MIWHRKSLLLLVLALVLLVLLFLAAGLSQLELKPGRLWVFPGGGDLGDTPALGEPSWVGAALLAVRVLMTVVVLALPFALFYFLVSPEARRKLVRRLVSILLFALILHLVLSTSIEQDERSELPASGETPFQMLLVEPDYTPPRWLVVASNTGLALLIVLVLAVIGRFIWRLRWRKREPWQELAQEAEEAIEAIRAGGDPHGLVVACYRRMSRTLQRQRGFRRHVAMTPQEFVSYLEEAGVPGEDVRRLTHLFERVRYGAKDLTQEEEQQALVSLGAIVEFCRSVQ